jgi:uncharacterized protein
MRWILPLLLAIVATALPAHAQDFPALTGRVVDQANVLDPAQEAALSAKLEGLETRTKRQLVVATISDLQGYDISDYGYRLGRQWAIGQDGKGEAEKDNGAILIVAPNERRMRIEVGYGLEPVLTDGFSSSVIRNTLTPYFKSGDLPGGINAGVDKIITQIELPPEEAAKIAAQADKAARTKNSEGEFGAALFWLFIFFFFILPIIMSFARGGKRHRRGYGGPVIIWDGGGSSWGGSSGSSWGSSSGSSWGGGGGFSGGGGSFGGGGASGGW